MSPESGCHSSFGPLPRTGPEVVGSNLPPRNHAILLIEKGLPTGPFFFYGFIFVFASNYVQHLVQLLRDRRTTSQHRGMAFSDAAFWRSDSVARLY
jgi:hypothetical protein